MKEMVRGSVEISEVDMGCEVQYVQFKAALGDDCCNQYIDDPVKTYLTNLLHISLKVTQPH